MKDSKEDQENVKQLEKDAEAARMTFVEDDRQYNPEDESKAWSTDTDGGC